MNPADLEKIIALRHELHAHPELSLHEAWTKRRLMDFIEAHTSLAVVDCGNWFYAAHYVEGTQAVAFRADMDALPIPEAPEFRPWASRVEGVSHKCGHDGHSAALCGLALGLERLPVRPRSVYLIFQHAEETGQGGEACAALLPAWHVAEVYAFHNRSGWPEGSVVVRSGLCQLASRGITLRVMGRPSHASEPEKGKNPAFILAKLISAIEMGLMPEVRCTIVNVRLGGKEPDFGISPGEGEISLTLRSERAEDMDRLGAALQDFARGSGFESSLTISDPFPETVSDEPCTARVAAAARALGKRVIPMEEPWRASEDFGWYTKRCPGAIFYIGNGESWPALHTPEYDFNDAILETAADMFLEIYRKGLA